MCYSVCTFVVKREDIEYNDEILSQIKYLMGCKPEHEAKYTAIRRNRKSKEIHTLISQMKGTIVSWIAFKKRIDNPTLLDVKKKWLSQLCHAFPIEAIKEVLIKDPGKSVLIVIDVMKKVEMDGVSNIVNSNEFFGFDNDGKQIIGKYDLIFRDSKDKDFQLIQAADYYAGIVRDCFENYDVDHMIWKCCKFCNPKKILCKYKNKKIPLEGSENLRKVINMFLRDEKGSVILNGITPFPLKLFKQMRFVDCVIVGKRTY